VKFKYLGLLYTNDGKRNKEIDTRIVKNAVLRELYRFVVVKRELSNSANLPANKLAFVPIFTMAERILSQVQAAEMGFREEFTR